jgi:hypothetical protein
VVVEQDARWADPATVASRGSARPDDGLPPALTAAGLTDADEVLVTR